MTIPSIGGGSGFGDNKNNFSKKSDVASPQSSQIKNNASKNIVDENPIITLYKNFESVLMKEVIPKLNESEPERKKWFVLTIFTPLLLLIASFLIALLYVIIPCPIVFASPICGVIICNVVWATMAKNFEFRLKRKYMPVLMKAIPNFHWQEKSPIPLAEIRKSLLFNDPTMSFVNKNGEHHRKVRFNSRTQRESKLCFTDPEILQDLFRKIGYSKVFDDCFIGEYKGVKISIAEFAFRYWEVVSNNGKQSLRRRCLFDGAVIKLKMNKNFEGKTVIRPKTFFIKPDCTDLLDYGMEKVELEDPEFQKAYEVYSTDQIEARYLMTTSFMQRFKDISLAFKSQGVYCSFSDDCVYIAPEVDKDLFNLFRLTKPLGNIEQFKTLMNEFVSIIQLVEHFKLDQKLGL